MYNVASMTTTMAMLKFSRFNLTASMSDFAAFVMSETARNGTL
jgi:hypothetical protein